MDILHLSDVHLRDDAPQRTLNELWNAPGAALDRTGQNRFDAIVVSGDLTQKADPAEYDSLLEFAKETLIPLLKEGLAGAKEKRVVFVPGNHDVNWSVPIVRDGEVPGVAEPLREAEQIWRLSDRVRRRVDLSDGRIRIRELLDERQYAKRLENCQRFLKSFYGDALSAPPNHCFDLLRPPDDGEDWAAHVFEEEQVAFLCFNSCHANDRYWTGGYLSRAAIEKCRKAARAKLPNHFKVAVWHHGLASERGRPDYLALSDIGPIEAMGCRVAFHGHVHKAGLEVPKLLRDRITIVATGSLGAGQTDRPEVVSNQFSVVRLHPTRVAVTVFDRRPESDQYEAGRVEIHPIFGPSAARNGARASAKSIVRDFLVGEDGISRIRLGMTDVRTGGADLPLAVVQTASRQIRAGDAWVDGERRVVRETQQPDGSVRYCLPATTNLLSRIDWEYLIANTLALTQEDLRRKERSPLATNLKADEDALGYQVRVDCDRLELRLKFERSTGAAAAGPVTDTVHSLVEMKFAEGGEERWKPIESEAARCRVRADGPDGASLEVDAPIPDLRYHLVYRPAHAGKTVPAAAAAIAERLLDLSRNDMAQGAVAVALLTRSVGTAVRLVLGGSQVTRGDLEAAVGRVRPPGGSSSVLGLDGQWCGYLWNDGRKLLQPAFGEFAPSLWGNDFGSGVGVVGHAFRFGASAIWAGSAPADQPRRASLIFERHKESHADVNWVVSVPILAAPGGRAIGAVAFAGPKPRGRQNSVGGRLARMASDMVGYEEAPREGRAELETPHEAVERQQRLLEAVNLFFWGAVAEGSIFAAEDRADAKAILERLAPAAPAPTQPGALASAPTKAGE